MMNIVHTYGTVLRSLLLLACGVPLVWVGSRALQTSLQRHLNHHIGIILSSLVFYSGLGIIIISVLHDFGFQISALLGAAGIVGIAVGFAAQTSIANIISGIFLLLEHSFEVGDIITCNNVTGTVESIGLLSITLTTSDNIMVRLPHEMLLKNALTNSTRHDKRRLTFRVRISSTASVDHTKQVIAQVVTTCPFSLEYPVEYIALGGTTHWSSEIYMHVWVRKENIAQAAEYYITQIKKETDMMVAVTRLDVH
jgi:small-conductance mechanosensitive channel